MSNPAIQHFKPSEFLCQCGKCDLTYDAMDADFLRLLESARGEAGVPFVLTSALRCSAYNARVGGVPDSAHTRGMAGDVAATDSRTRFLIIYGAVMAGFKRIGINDEFIHLDSDPDKPQPVIWPY